MNGRRKLTMWCLATIVAAGPLGPSSRASAVIPADVVIPGSVALSVTTPSGVPGLCCKYDLTVSAGSLEVLGVIVVNALTLFGVGPASPIVAPTGWGFIPPLDADAADLFYFPNTSDADIKPNTTLGGFVFVSTETFQPFKVDLVVEGGLQEVNIVPEPSSFILLSLGLAGLAGLRRSRPSPA
jgi:hypothetical protein